MVKFEDILADIGDFGRYQRLRYFLICLAGLLPPIATYINSFITALPDYKCNIGDQELNHYVNASQQTDKCYYSVNGTVQKCISWQFDKTYYQKTLTEEWSLVCDRAHLRSFAQSIYFCGYVVGSLAFGAMADKYGRRPLMLLAFVLLTIGFTGMAVGPQESLGFVFGYTVYTISRFLMACGTRGINETGYVLALEMVSSKKRSRCAIGFEFSFSLGQLVLAFFAFFVRDWRYLTVIMIALTVPFLSYALMLHESPRWLVTTSRSDEALTIMKHIAKSNKKRLNEHEWNEFVNNFESSGEAKKETLLTLIKSLCKYPSQLIFLMIMFFNWIANNFVFYGVGLKSVDLGVDPYLSFSISAAVESLAFCSILLIIDRLGRKRPYFFFLFTAGVSCLSTIFTDNLYISLGFAMLGKFAVSASYAILRLYSNELFPTSVRNTCIGACSMISRISVILAPIINSLGDTSWKPLPFLIFGIVSISASFSSCLLPETLNRTLPENIEDAHRQNGFKNVFDCFQRPKSPKSDIEQSQPLKQLEK